MKKCILGMLSVAALLITSSQAHANAQRPFCCVGNVTTIIGAWCIVTQQGANILNNYYNTTHFGVGDIQTGSHCSEADLCANGEGSACGLGMGPPIE